MLAEPTGMYGHIAEIIRQKPKKNKDGKRGREKKKVLFRIVRRIETLHARTAAGRRKTRFCLVPPEGKRATQRCEVGEEQGEVINGRVIKQTSKQKILKPGEKNNTVNGNNSENNINNIMRSEHIGT